jgi:hypothetical protein
MKSYYIIVAIALGLFLIVLLTQPDIMLSPAGSGSSASGGSGSGVTTVACGSGVCASGEYCCNKEVCCGDKSECSTVQGKSYCNWQSCPAGYKLCKADDWNSCCRESAQWQCLTVEKLFFETAECGRASCWAGEFACGGKYFDKGNVRCCRTGLEKCDTSHASFSYPICVALDVQREGYKRCVGKGGYSWSAIWCLNSEFCMNDPVGTPRCYVLK